MLNAFIANFSIYTITAPPQSEWDICVNLSFLKVNVNGNIHNSVKSFVVDFKTVSTSVDFAFADNASLNVDYNSFGDQENVNKCLLPSPTSARRLPGQTPTFLSGLSPYPSAALWDSANNSHSQGLLSIDAGSFMVPDTIYFMYSGTASFIPVQVFYQVNDTTPKIYATLVSNEIPSLSSAPSASPSSAPTVSLSTAPTVSPSTAPIVFPSTAPSASPSTAPTVFPTSVPTVSPTSAPTASPSTDFLNHIHCIELLKTCTLYTPASNLNSGFVQCCSTNCNVKLDNDALSCSNLPVSCPTIKDLNVTVTISAEHIKYAYLPCCDMPSPCLVALPPLLVVIE